MEYLFSLDDFYDNIVSEGRCKEGHQKSCREMEILRVHCIARKSLMVKKLGPRQHQKEESMA